MNCMELALKAAKGRLTDQEVIDAFDQHDKIREALIAAGKTDNLDSRVARIIAEQAMAKKIEAARLRRQVAQNIRARTKLDQQVKTFMKAGLSPRKALIAAWEGSQRNIPGARVSGYAQGQAYEAKWIGSAFAEIEKERPHIIGLMSDKAFDERVTRELFELREGGKPGITNDSDAQFMARVLSAHMEMARVQLNELGAAIGKLDGYAGPQVHDDVAMLKVTASKWVDDILPLLDVSRSFPDAKDMAEVKDILSDVYETIVTGVSNKDTPLTMGKRVGPASLAKRMGKSRVLHFKDADASLKYRDQYGRGSTIQGIFGQLRNHAHMAGAFETFGPNPKAMMLSIAGRLQRDLKTLHENAASDAERKKIGKWINELRADDGEVRRLKSTIDSITGMASRPVNVTAANLGQNFRSWQALAKLGGAVLTAIPSDTATMAASAMFRGDGYFAGVGQTLSEIANRADGKEVGYLLGEGFDGIIGHLSSSYAEGVPGQMSKALQFFFKWSGLSGWTDTARSASARVIAAGLGRKAGLSFDKLPEATRYLFNLHGITPEKWNALRAGAEKASNGNKYLLPDAARSAPDELILPIVKDQIAALPRKNEAAFEKAAKKIIDRARRELEIDLHRYYADETSYAVVETDAASRRFSTAGFRPGTIEGEAIRFVMQFKGFPIAFSQRILGRTFMNAPQGRGQQVAHIAALMAGLAGAGYMAMTMKDMAAGKWPPRDPLNAKTWGAAALQGGALGIYGDFLFGAYSRFGMGAFETAAGPMVGTASQIFRIWEDLRSGDPNAGNLLSTAVDNTPFINLFYTRAALDFLFLNELREMARPGTLARQKKRLEQERGQQYILPRRLSEAVR